MTNHYVVIHYNDLYRVHKKQDLQTDPPSTILYIHTYNKSKNTHRVPISTKGRKTGGGEYSSDINESRGISTSKLKNLKPRFSRAELYKIIAEVNITCSFSNVDISFRMSVKV